MKVVKKLKTGGGGDVGNKKFVGGMKHINPNGGNERGQQKHSKTTRDFLMTREKYS